MYWRRALGIATGGVIGAAIRWTVLTSTVGAGLFPWAVLVVNVAGSIMLGALLAEEWVHPRARLWFHDIGGIGFCGGLTTFSTFTVEIVDLIRRDEVMIAILYGVLSVALAIGGVLGGAAAIGRVRAVALPLEERP